MDGHKPFYVGQHIEENNIEFFLMRNKCNYIGSGVIWNKFINKLKKTNPGNWRNFIKREVLFSSEGISQSGLDKLEEFWIKKTKSHYSYKIGGCNATQFVKSGVMEAEIAKKISYSKKNGYHPYRGKHLSEEHRHKISLVTRGDKNPFFGKKHSEEVKKKISESNKGRISPLRGRKMSDEARLKMSISAKKRMSNPLNNPMYGRHHTEETINKIKNNPNIINRKITEHVRKKMSESHKLISVGRKMITNGERNAWLRTGEEIPNGWHLGITKKRKEEVVI
jgi:hypothetical protein